MEVILIVASGNGNGAMNVPMNLSAVAFTSFGVEQCVFMWSVITMNISDEILEYLPS